MDEARRKFKSYRNKKNDLFLNKFNQMIAESN